MVTELEEVPMSIVGGLDIHRKQVTFEAAKTSARSCAPGYRYYTEVKDRYDANRATLSQARRIVRQAVHLLTDLGEDAFAIIAQPAAPSMVTR
jgi:hypothetical protein